MKKTFLILLILSVCLSAFAESVIDSASFNIFAKYGNTDSSYTLSIVNLYADTNSEIANNERIPVSVEDFDSVKTQKDHIDLFKVVLNHKGYYANDYTVNVDSSKGFIYADNPDKREGGEIRYTASATVSSEQGIQASSETLNPQTGNGNDLKKEYAIKFEKFDTNNFKYELTIGIKANDYTDFLKKYNNAKESNDVLELDFTVSLEAN